MRIGVSLGSFHPVDDPRLGARHMIERTRAVRDAGLDLLSVGDHHVNDRPYYQNTPILGRLLAEWDDRPAGSLYLVPLWSAVLMAEQIGTLAAIAQGPFVVQTGLGGGPAESAAIGVDHRTRVSRYEETIRVVRALLAGEVVTSDRLGIEGARISPTPAEPAQWWIGGGADTALDRAARLGDAWYGGPDLEPPAASERLRYFLAACDREGREPSCFPLRRDVFVADSAAEAKRVGDEMIAAGYRGMTSDAVVYGGVEEVVHRFGELGKLGFTDIIVRQMAVPQARAVESYHLLGEVRRQLDASEGANS